MKPELQAIVDQSRRDYSRGRLKARLYNERGGAKGQEIKLPVVARRIVGQSGSTTWHVGNVGVLYSPRIVKR